MTPEKTVRNPILTRFFWIGITAFVVLQLYYVRETLPLLILFGLLFSVGASIVLVLYLISHVGQVGLAKAEPYAISAARAGRRGLDAVGEFRKKQLRRQNSEIVP
jgi:hypothetical protein